MALAALIVAVALPGSALAAPTWLAPVSLSAPGYNGEDPQLGVDQAGDTVAAWVRFDGSNEIVQGAERPAGGSWSAAVNLSAPGEDAEDPRLAVDAAGDAVAVWRRYDGTDDIVEAASRPPGGSWGVPVDLSAGGENADSPSVAVDPAGDAVAVWRRYDGTDEIIQASTRTAGGVWQAPVDLSESGENAYRPQIAVDGAGDAVAVWDRSDGVHTIVQAASRPAGGSWGPSVDLSAAGESAVEAQVAVDPAGDAVVVWQRYNGTNDVVQAAERTVGGAWQPSVDLSESAEDASYPDVAVDPAGDAVAVWEVREGGYYVIQGANLTAGRTWRAPVDVSAPGHYAQEARVAVDPAGDAVALWGFYEGTYNIAQAATQAAGGAWQPGVDLSAPGEEADELEVAVDPAGDAVAAWSRSDGSFPVVQVAGYDAVGPQLRSLSIPTSGTVGTPLSFSVSPLDVWSALGATTWSFGDGTSAAGTAVSHTFTTPGTYTVEVTGTDVLGNASTATGTVAIVASPPAPTGRKGKARARRVVRVKGRLALLALACPGGAGCAGTARLSVRTKTKRSAAASARRRAKPIAIGKATFDLAAGRHRTIELPLTRKGRALVAAAGRKGVKARLAGGGVVGRAVVLKAVGHRRRR
ncbi:MAG TPA: PKD domain-containing protein [Solirubrobacterales bacterium]|nr:PKD domain-containing protein [Solirubrobacterales bacterium]